MAIDKRNVDSEPLASDNSELSSRVIFQLTNHTLKEKINTRDISLHLPSPLWYFVIFSELAPTLSFKPLWLMDDPLLRYCLIL